MLDLKVIQDRPEELDFNFAGEKVKGKAFPFKVTPTYLDNLRRLARRAPQAESKGEGEQPQEEKVQNADAQMISEIIPEWDVLFAGQPFPPTFENLIGAPISFLGAAASAILDLVGKDWTTSESKS